MSSNNENLKNLLNKKIKYHFQFDFMGSKYFKNWLKDPIKIYEKVRKVNFIQKSDKVNEKLNKNCLKFPNHSENLSNLINKIMKFIKNFFCKLLIILFFTFQNNPLKFGKKQRYE
jgi:hypothetical protein